MSEVIHQIDAFTDQAFAGNPAAVCLLETSRSDEWMQNVAAEMNLSETAFLRRRDDGFELRWFTPAAEVDLCGHATLASAHALWSSGALAPDATARFHTRSGLLTAIRRGDAIELDLPAIDSEPIDTPPGLVLAIGATPEHTRRSRFDYIAVLDGERAVRELRPDMTRVRTLPVKEGVIVTAVADPGPFDFVSRFFAPAVGIDEDPVTGAAHCCLGPFWSERLGKSELVGYQASRRGGVVRVRMAGDRAHLTGQAVTVLVGELHA